MCAIQENKTIFVHSVWMKHKKYFEEKKTYRSPVPFSLNCTVFFLIRVKTHFVNLHITAVIITVISQ